MTAVAERLDEEEHRPPPRVFGKTWIAFALLLMMVVSEYRFEGRSQQEALAGNADTRATAEVVVYVLVAVLCLMYVARPPTGRRLPSLLVMRWGFTLSMLFVAFFSPFPKLAIVRAVQLIIVTWLCQLIATEADREQLWKFTHAFIVLVVVSIGVGLAIPFPREFIGEARFTWLLVHPNISGAFMAIASVVLIAALLQRRRQSAFTPWPQWVYFCAFLVTFGGLLACRSRGSLAATLVGIGVVLWSQSRRRSRLDLALIGSSLFGCVYLLVAGDIAAWLQRGESDQQITSLNSRTDVWEQSWELFLHRPWFGHGYMSARGVFLERFELGGAHNAFMEVIVNGGLFGIFWWIAMLFVAFRGAGRLGAQRFGDGPLLLGVLSCLLVNALTDGGLGQGTNVHGLWLAVAIGWILAAERWRRAEQARAQARPRYGPRAPGDQFGSNR
jgi:exopolysaccharide production protein ExoQ